MSQTGHERSRIEFRVRRDSNALVIFLSHHGERSKGERVALRSGRWAVGGGPGKRWYGTGKPGKTARIPPHASIEDGRREGVGVKRLGGSEAGGCGGRDD